MKKIIMLSAMASSLLLATNGDNLISLGAESRAMGGTGIAMAMGTDSVFRNPAWLADVQGTEAMFGATLFMPDVKAKNAAQGSGVEATSKADLSLIPAVAHAGRINENLAYGVGMFGVSGMGVDYRNEDQTKALGNTRTNFQYMRFVPSIGYKTGDLRLGAGLTLAYGVLDIASVGPDANNVMAQRSGGVSDAFGFGAQLGAGYSLTPNVNVGAYYQTAVSTTYKDVYDFSANGVYDDLKLSQPAEYGVGVAYKNNGLTLTADVKQIKWSDADGYDAFGWDDQTVYSLGTAYDVNEALTLRAGYSQGDSPLGDGNLPAATVAGVPMTAQQISGFNLMGFPAISEQHMTAGLGYQFSKHIGVDLAYVYSPKETLSIFGGAVQATNEQNSISGALKYKFD